MSDMEITPEEAPEEANALDQLHRVITVLEACAGLAVTVWFLWDMTKDDPLGIPAQLRRWWEAKARERLRRRRERYEIANFGLELLLYLEREVNKWRTTAP